MAHAGPVRVAGVDGAPGGWIAAIVDLPSAEVAWRFVTDAAEIPALGERVGVDIPIGLPKGPEPRVADGAARKRLPGSASSVFPTPVRAVLGAADYVTACSVSRRACGRAISKQTWFITPKIAAMDACLTPAHDDVVAEVHPEVSFAAMAGGVAAPPKKTREGQAERVARLERWLGPGVLALVVSAPKPARADDALDALACAWTAWRWARGEHKVLGDPLARDARGLPMRILI